MSGFESVSREEPFSDGPFDLLLIEDDADGARRFEEHLEEGPVQATLRHEKTLAAGLEALRAGRPDVLVLDLGLPGREGLDAVQAAVVADPTVPIVVLTGPSDLQTALRVRKAGVAEYLEKGDLTPTLLERTLRWAVREERMERKLRQQDAWVRSITESLSAGVFRVGPSGRIEYANEALAEMLGFEDPEGLVGRDLMEFYADPDQEGRVLVGDEVEGSEVELKRSGEKRSGESTVVGLLSAKPTYDAGGQVLHYDGTITDVTGRKEKEEKLRVLSEAVCQAKESVLITEAAPLDEPGPRIEYVNEACEEITGYSEEELLGETPRVLQGPDTEREVLDSFRAALEAGKEWQGVTVNYRKDGEPYRVEWNVAPVTGEDGTIEHWVSVQRDVTEERESEEQLRRQKRLLEQTQRLAGAWEVDLRTGEMSWSEKVYQIHEVEPSVEISVEEGIGFYAPEARPKIRKAFERLVEEGGSYDLEISIITAEKNRRWVRTVGAPSEIEDGEIVKVAGALQDITERKQAEEALKEREARLRGLANSIPGVVYQFYARPDGTYGLHFVSEHAEEVLGLSAEPEGFYERFVERVPASHRESFEKSVEQATKDETPWQFELPFEKPSGERIWVLGTSTPEKRGEELIFNGVLLDITERKQAEEALQEERDRLETLFESLPTPVVRSQIEGEKSIVTAANPAFGDVFGISPEEAEGRDLNALIVSEEKRPEALEIDRRAWKEGSVEVEVCRVAATGERIFQLQVAGRRQEDALLEVYAIYTDITERKERERKLRILSETVEQANDGVLVTEAPNFEEGEEGGSGPIVYANAAFEKMTGYAEGELRGRGPQVLRGPETDPEVIASLAEAQKEGRSWQGETVNYKKDGTPYIAQWTAAPIFGDDDGQVQYWVSIQRDVTEKRRREETLREAKEEAEEASRMKSVFLANMSHELRTPLTSVIGFAEAIGEDEEAASRFAPLIEKSGRRLMETLNGVLNFSKLEAGEMDLSVQPVDLAVEAEEIAEEFQPRAEKKELALQVESGEDPVRATADEGGVQMILRNLLSNAIKYTEEGGQVWIRAYEEEGEAAVLEVEDTGIGMAPEKADRLFEPFKQESEGPAREYEGTGLGLAIVQRVADQMGGTVEVETEKGEGTRFTVQLPRAEAPKAKESEG